MPIATVAIDLAKTVFELAAADENGKIVDRRRLSRTQLERYFQNCGRVRVVMEACGTSHHWARVFAKQDLRVSLLPPHYVRAYVRRNMTDSADATALLEAARASDITPVRVKSLEQRGLQGLHRIRSAWRATRTARINTLAAYAESSVSLRRLAPGPGFSRCVAHSRRRTVSFRRFCVRRCNGCWKSCVYSMSG